ncbi:HlyD family secretion protein [Chelatococcus sp. GCM10030263]|uniref:HlyD family secretion protein n=1 Tax=Chelatococcus sp. GCM10030263 TaxID=3273387 RepID=UPI00361147D0
MTTPLFREEVVGRELDQIGVPLGMTTGWMRLFALCLTVAVVAALVGVTVGSYTRKERVVGFLVPDKGLIKVISPRDGRVVERHVREGNGVRRDDMLYVVDVASATSVGRTGDLVARELRERRRLLAAERARRPTIAAAEEARLKARVTAIAAQLESIEAEVASRATVVALGQKAVQRALELEQKSVFAAAKREEIEQNLAASRAVLAQLARVSAELEGERRQIEADLESLADRQANEGSQIDRQLSEIDQQLSQAEEQRAVVLRAPRGGTVTRLAADIGQRVDPATPLATIVPDGATLQAQLYLPTRAAGFVKPGNRVNLFYEAYPYQKFGIQKGTVLSVTRAAVIPRELPFPVASDEPHYVVTVKLERQTITAYGREERPQAGARLLADILVERRRLWEWILSPLISLAKIE